MFELSKNVLKQALDLSPVATVIIDRNAPVTEITYVNHAFEAMSGFDAAELLGLPWSQFLVDQVAESESEHLAELECHPRLGVSDRLKLDMLPLYDRPGTPRYWVGTECKLDAETSGGDSEREALLGVLRDARMHLRRLDGRDSTTGILNRRAFDDIFQRDWVMARREKRSLGIMLFRLDAFDAYSEVFGRHAADSCLRKVAHAITGSLRRAGDLAARFSDDQFAVLITAEDENAVNKFADSIAGKVRELSIHHPRSLVDRFVTVSHGSAVMVPTDAVAPDALMKAANEKLLKEFFEDQNLSAL